MHIEILFSYPGCLTKTFHHSLRLGYQPLKDNKAIWPWSAQIEQRGDKHSAIIATVKVILSAWMGNTATIDNFSKRGGKIVQDIHNITNQSSTKSLCAYFCFADLEVTKLNLLFILSNSVFVPQFRHLRVYLYLRLGSRSNLIICAESTSVSPGQGPHSDVLSTCASGAVDCAHAHTCLWIYVEYWEHMMDVVLYKCHSTLAPLRQWEQMQSRKFYNRKTEQVQWFIAIAIDFSATFMMKSRDDTNTKPSYLKINIWMSTWPWLSFTAKMRE